MIAAAAVTVTALRTGRTSGRPAAATTSHPCLNGVPLTVITAPLVQAAESAFRFLFGENIKPESPDRASIWTDTNIYNELGIPAIKIGPRGRRISARNEEIEVEEMVKAAQLYALLALDICSRTRAP